MPSRTRGRLLSTRRGSGEFINSTGKRPFPLSPFHPSPLTFSRNRLGTSSVLDSVNLGGWFVLEPFISPELFQRYADAGAIDEWTISTLMAADTANGGLGQLERHYDTFIVRQITLKLQFVQSLTDAIPPSCHPH